MIRMNAGALLGRLLIGAGILASQTVRADDPQRCAAMADDQARLACYDALFRPRDGAPRVSAPAVPAAPVSGAATATVAVAPVAETATTAEADFGLTEAAKRAREPEESREKLPESISATVAKVARQPAGELVVTLENGQVWTQVQVDSRARIAVGDTVSIRKAALGSHLLVTANSYATRVRRVK